MRNFSILFFFFVTAYSFSQFKAPVVKPPYYIKTARIDNFERPYYTNIINLNKSFSLSFDDLHADEKNYYYKIIRYDENWNESSIQTSEYIEGFDSDIITGMQQSTATLQSYMHYEIKFPNENTAFLLSGNYIIEILDEDDNVVFSKAFILYDKKLEAGIRIRWPENVGLQNSKQQVDFFLYPGSLNLQNPSENLKIVLIQNYDWGRPKIFHAPAYYQANKWIYHYPSYSVFDGINEFRRFETKDLRGMNYNIVKKEKNGNLYDFYIFPDEKRTRYTYYEDADGNFYIQSLQAGENISTEADYVYVHFSYAGIPEKNEKIYVCGKFNDFNPPKDDFLKYNPETGYYETSLLLKQGYYEYWYLSLKNGIKSFVPIEGDFSETENLYELVIYYKAPGKRYTEVIGYARADSRNIN